MNKNDSATQLDNISLGSDFFDQMLAAGQVVHQTEVPQAARGVSNLRKSFQINQVYCKKIDTQGWRPAMVDKLVTNIQHCYEAFGKKSQELLKTYYQQKIDAGLIGFADKKLEELYIPTVDEINQSFDLHISSYTDRDSGETITNSVEIIWLKPVIEALSGLWIRLIQDAGAPLTKMVKGKGGKSKEVSTSPEYRMLRSRRFDDPENPDAAIGKNGLTLRFIIPDAGTYNGFCDCWVGPKFMPPQHVIKRRNRYVQYEGGGEIEAGEYDHPQRTVFYPFDYNRGDGHCTRYARWNNSWVQLVFDYRGLENVNGVPTPSWDVLADGQKVVFVQQEGSDRKRPSTVNFFARRKGENDKIRINNTFTGFPIDLISYIFGGEKSAVISGQERIVQASGEQIVFGLGFVADSWTIHDLIMNAEDFAAGKIDDLAANSDLIIKRTVKQNDDGETATLSDFVDSKKNNKKKPEAATDDEEEEVTEESATESEDDTGLSDDEVVETTEDEIDDSNDETEASDEDGDGNTSDNN